jgi:hypothetical protein
VNGEGRNVPYAALELHIEELVLHGFAPGDRYQIGEAVEHELARLFAEQGAPGWLAEGGEIGRVDGGAFEMTPGSKAGTIGTQVAHAIHGGLTK